MGTFLWAGSALPFYATGMALRWLFLAVGGLGGFVIWIKNPRPRHFGAIHLVAALCVLSALVSAIVSEVPRTALLKVASLFLLFLYASSGARVTIAGQQHRFMGSLVLACEVLAYVSAVCYFALGYAVFGNPNALGAIIGVAVVPVLLWAAVAAETRGLRQRRFSPWPCVAACFTSPTPGPRLWPRLWLFWCSRWRCVTSGCSCNVLSFQSCSSL